MNTAPIKLHGRVTFSRIVPVTIRRLTRSASPHWPIHQQALLGGGDGEPCPECDVILEPAGRYTPRAVDDRLHIALPPELEYLEDGDIVRLDPEAGSLHVLYRKSANANSLLVTERCNSYCTMCSQPPKTKDDSYLADEAIEVISLIDPTAPEIGITGGEPALLGDRLFDIVAAVKDRLPRTALHILTNGRLFAYLEQAQRLREIGHSDLMLGIPLYSDLPWAHDFVVQARGAFDQTIRGILNLGRVGVPIEIRVVIHRDTYSRIPELARFIARNLPFVHHVALMGLEQMGHTRMNLEALWIDPVDYQKELVGCVEVLDRASLRVSIYNHPLCVLDPSIQAFAVRSISDWKQVYIPECENCTAREQCGGFFASSTTRRSRAIHPIKTIET